MEIISFAKKYSGAGNPVFFSPSVVLYLQKKRLVNVDIANKMGRKPI